jgi:small redox-active disulfide protein 2
MTMIRILGTGCPKCRQLADNARAAAEQLGIDHTIEKVTQINDIMKFGVMLTPALVIGDEVKTAGKVPDVEQIMEMLQNA